MVPPREWYPPDLNATQPNLGDSPQRMYWRTKQNLDYLFLMLYCRELGSCNSLYSLMDVVRRSIAHP